jgi:hypothetical protein
MVHPTSGSASYVSRPSGAAHVRLLTRLSQRYALGSSSSALGGSPRRRLPDDAATAGACPREQAIDAFDRVRLGSSALLASEQGQAGHAADIGIVARAL